MSTDALSIRPARPDLDEGRVFARFVDEITEGGFSAMLGRRFVEILAHAFVRPGHAMSYEHTSFAERDGAIVGMVCARVEDGVHDGEYDALMAAPGNRVRRRLATALLRLRWRMIGYPFPGEYYVEFLIVDSTLRGHGIGRVLMQEMESRASAAGVSRLTLDVAAKNTRGQRFYERFGMACVPDWPPSRLGRRVIRRMTKEVARQN